jgi:hypothetical protein
MTVTTKMPSVAVASLLACLLAGTLFAQAKETQTMIPAALKRAIAQQHSALNEFVKGNVAPWNQICSQADDATIIGGWGGFEKGWSAQVEKRYRVSGIALQRRRRPRPGREHLSNRHSRARLQRRHRTQPRSAGGN